MTATATAGSRFVGRARELAELRGWLAESQTGRGRMTVLRGEPGMGKTRLAEELAAAARGIGVPVVWGRCSADSGAPPLWPLRRIAEQLPGQHAWLPAADLDAFGSSSEGSAAARFAQLVRFSDALVAAAAATGLLVIVEDLHWADSATAGALGHLAAELGRSRALVVVTARTKADSDSGALAAVLDRATVEQRQLVGLDRPAIVEYLNAVHGGPVDERYADLVLRQTAGNSLYVGAVARLLSEQVSLRSFDIARSQAALSGRPELLDLIREPMGRVSAACREIVEWASVAGEEFGIVELGAACGLPADTVTRLVDEAVEAGLMTRPADAPGTARFVHALVRDGVYEDVERPLRSSAHRAWADAVGETDSRLERIGVVARHLARGASTPAEHQRAASAARDAGQAAIADFAYAEAVGQFGSALYSLSMAGGASDRAEILLDLAFAEYRSGAFGASLEHCAQAADLAEAQHRWDLLARAALLVDGVSAPGLVGSQVGLYERALAQAPDSESSVRAQLQARLAYAAADDGDIRRAQSMSADALALAEQTDDPAALMAAFRARHQALGGAGNAEARLLLGARAIGLADRGEPMAALWGRVWRVDSAFEVGDLAAVDRELAELATLADTLRFPLAGWHLHRLRAARESLVGRFALAEEQAATARDLAGNLDDESVLVLDFAFRLYLCFTRGDSLLDLGRESEVRGFLEMAVRVPLPIAQASVGLARVAAGDLDEAARIARRLSPQAPSWPVDGRWLVTVTILSEVVADVQDAESAAVLYPLLKPFAHLSAGGGAGTVACEGSVSRHLGRLAAVCGRLEVAETHLRDAIAFEDRMGARPFVATSRMYLARVLMARGGTLNRASAAREARMALGAMRALQMRGRATQCEEVLAAIDAEMTESGALTPREREIVALVADGLTNRQIADRLFVSERTVETHVSHVLGKLGAGSRTDIATWAVSGGLTNRSNPGTRAGH